MAEMVGRSLTTDLLLQRRRDYVNAKSGHYVAVMVSDHDVIEPESNGESSITHKLHAPFGSSPSKSDSEVP